MSRYTHPTWPDESHILIGDIIRVTDWPDMQGTIVGITWDYGEGEPSILADFPHRPMGGDEFAISEVTKVGEVAA